MRVCFAARPLAIVAVGCLLTGPLSGAAHAAPLSEADRSHGGEQYFIDFRARPSTYIGHTFVIYGRVNADGRVVEKHTAGLIPEQNVWVGLFAPIRATVREYKDDSRITPSVIYRRQLTAVEYRRVDGTVRRLRGSDHRWHAVFRNCNDFGIAIADALGLWRPPSLLPPSVWVTMLRALNRH